jgi:hypothetical protein
MKKTTYASILRAGGISFTMMIALSAQSQPNNNCASATVLTVGAACTNGTNVGSTLEIGEPTPACWLTAANTTVWYRFTTGAAGNYVVSTDNGGTTDTQMQLYSSACGIYTPVAGACSEDNGTTNTLAAVVSANLAAGTQYWVQVDVYNTATGAFCISVQYVPPVANDCVLSAIDITSLINPVSTANPFDCNHNYAYNQFAGTGDDPTQQTVVGDPNGCNGVLLPLMNPNPTHYDIWFKFTVSGATPAAYLQLYPVNVGDPMIPVMGLYSGTPNCVCPTGNITGLTYIDCSAGEVLDVPPVNTYGGARDEAVCSTPVHPRLDISGLAPGTYYIRVWDFGGFNGLGSFALCSESIDPRPNSSDICTASPNIGYTGTSRNVNVNTTYTGLSNAGSHGNGYAAQGSNTLVCTGAVPNEPSLGATPAGEARDGCTGGWITYVGTVNNIMNLTEIHSFRVNACGPGCEPTALVRLNNIVLDGTPGNVAQLQVMAPGNCTGSTQTIMNAVTSQSCIEMRVASNAPLANGDYSIVIDGQDGQLVSYDLTIILNYPCPVDTDVLGQPCLLPLPVALMTFSARHEHNVNVLDWKTASEINNAYFEIERSHDSKTFNTIGKITGAGNSSTVNTYAFTDNYPEKDRNYYRLKQTDFNGNITYSKIILINTDKSDLEIASIAPNPAKDKIEIMLTGNTENVRTDIINMVGKTVLTVDNGTKNSNPMQLDISTLEPGYYVVKISDPLSGNTIVRNFIKQ